MALEQLASRTISATAVFAGVSGALFLQMSNEPTITLVNRVSGTALFFGFAFGLGAVTIGPASYVGTLSMTRMVTTAYAYNVIVVAIHISFIFFTWMGSSNLGIPRYSRPLIRRRPLVS